MKTSLTVRDYLELGFAWTRLAVALPIIVARAWIDVYRGRR